MPTDVRRLFVLLCGFEILPKSISVRGADPRFIMSEPVCAYLLDTTHGWVLLDAGLNPENLETDEARQKHFLSHGMMPPIVRAAHRMEPQFERIGIGFHDVRHVILSHLHFDHCGYLKHFMHARISVQRREHTFAFSDKVGPAYILSDYDDPAVKWDLQNGDWTAMEGLQLIDTRGHTDGHQSALITLPKTGQIILPFDAGDLEENFSKELLPGEAIDDAAALAAIRRLSQLRFDLEATMLLFHDPVAIQHTKLCPDYYD